MKTPSLPLIGALLLVVAVVITLVFALMSKDSSPPAGDGPLLQSSIAERESGIHVVSQTEINGNRVYKVIVERESIDLTCVIWDGYRSGAVSCVEGR